MMVTRRYGLSIAREFGVESTLSVADQVASATVGFLVAFYVGREIGAEGLGIFAITSVLVLIVRSLQNSAILEAMSVLGPRRSPSMRGNYLGFLFGSELLWVGGITGIGAVAAILGTVTGVLNQAIFPVILSCLAYANLIGLQHLLRQQFYVEHRPALAFAQSSMVLVMDLAGLALLSLVGDPSVPRVYGVLSACSATICVLQLRRWWGRVALPDSESVRRYIMEHWHYGRWVLLAVPFVIGAYHAYYFLAGYLLSAEQTGFLKAVDTLIVPFEQIGIGLSMFLVPVAARRVDGMPAPEQRAWALQFLLFLLVLAVAYAAVIVVLGEDLLYYVFGGKLGDAAAIRPVMALIPLFRAIAVPAGVALTALKRPDLKCLSYAVATLGTLIGGIALTSWYGLLGAAIGLVFSLALFATSQWLCLVWYWNRA